MFWIRVALALWMFYSLPAAAEYIPSKCSDTEAQQKVQVLMQGQNPKYSHIKNLSEIKITMADTMADTTLNARMFLATGNYRAPNQVSAPKKVFGVVLISELTCDILTFRIQVGVP